EWLPDRQGKQESQDPERVALVFAFAGQQGQPQEAESRGRTPRGDGRILEVLTAGHQGLLIGGGGEEAALRRISEPVDDLVRQHDRLAVKPGLKGRLI